MAVLAQPVAARSPSIPGGDVRQQATDGEQVDVSNAQIKIVMPRLHTHAVGLMPQSEVEVADPISAIQDIQLAAAPVTVDATQPNYYAAENFAEQGQAILESAELTMEETADILSADEVPYAEGFDDPIFVYPESRVTHQDSQLVFDELMLYWSDKDAPPALDEEFLDGSVHNGVLVIEVDPDEPNSFESYVLNSPEVPAIEKLAEIEASAADEQPLKDTFAQLSLLFAESRESQDPKLESLRQDVVELGEIMLQIENDLVVGAEINPEVVQKLLVVLEKLGYRNPQSILTTFIKQHQPCELVDMISYMYSVTKIDSQEFVTSAIPQIDTQDDSVAVRLGRAVVAAIVNFPYVRALN